METLLGILLIPYAFFAGVAAANGDWFVTGTSAAIALLLLHSVAGRN